MSTRKTGTRRSLDFDLMEERIAPSGGVPPAYYGPPPPPDRPWRWRRRLGGRRDPRGRGVEYGTAGHVRALIPVSSNAPLGAPSPDHRRGSFIFRLTFPEGRRIPTGNGSGRPATLDLNRSLKNKAGDFLYGRSLMTVARLSGLKKHGKSPNGLDRTGGHITMPFASAERRACPRSVLDGP